MGGGYDNCEDADPDTCGTTKGNRIFVLDANTGNVVTSFPTTRGVVADVFVIRDDDGLAKWAYAVDMGGNIYRIGSGVDTNAEFGDTDPATEWTMTKIASLGCSTAGRLHAHPQVHDASRRRGGPRRHARDPGRLRRPGEAAAGLRVGLRREQLLLPGQ